MGETPRASSVSSLAKQAGAQSRKAVVVSGAICSGKSSVIKCLARVHGWDVVSFGAYVRHTAEQRGEEATRPNLQALGTELLSSLGAEKFLIDVIAHANPSSDVHVYDGVRHLAMLEALRRMYPRPVVVYLDVEANERYRRFAARSRHDDSVIPYEGFLAMCDEPVERGVEELRREADLCCAGSASVEEIVHAIEDVLQQIGGVL